MRAEREHPFPPFERDTIHRMARRCIRWDYYGTGAYLITLVLNDRASCALGCVTGTPPIFEPTPLGAEILALAKRIPEFTPEIQLLGVQLMPDHLHLVLRVTQRLTKPLGERLRGFKMGCTRIYTQHASTQAPAIRGAGLFADGFVDNLLFDDAAIHSALAYLADNPRRLAEKRAHPELFRVVRDLALPLTLHEQPGLGHFSALGNHHLLQQPTLLQVQCSRSDYTDPNHCTPAFTEKAEALLAAAAHGAVLVSPCLSPGEREIARRAFQQGHAVIALKNKGFSSLFKPSGALFDTCAQGKLLLLAPAAWPYLPGKKPITREDACTLNRLTQLLAGPGAMELHYAGITPTHIEELTAQAIRWEPK